MKYKKILTILFTLFIAVCLVGCGNTSTEKAVAKNIDRNTARLDSVVSALEDLNYDDIVIEDISPLADSTYKTTNTSALQKTKWYSIGNNSSKTYKPTEKNAKYVSKNNSEKIDINKQNEINSYCPDCEPNTSNLNTNTNQNSKSYNSKRLSNNTSNLSNYSNKTKYTPKYVNEVSDSFSRNSLDKYLSQIETVYNTCGDCIGCNAEINNQKSALKQNINECKTLSSKLKDGTIKLSDAEIAECNKCLDTLANCTSKLNLTRQNIDLKEKDVLKYKQTFGKNMTDINQAYEKLLLALESRLNYLQECNNAICSLCDIINKTNVNIG